MKGMTKLLILLISLTIVSIRSANAQCACAEYIEIGPLQCNGENGCENIFYESICAGFFDNCFKCQNQAGSGECCGTIYYSASTGPAWGRCGEFRQTESEGKDFPDGMFVPSSNGSFALVLPRDPFEEGK